MTVRALLLCLLLLAAAPCAALADSAPFDLTGPTLQVRVTHAGVTLPIAETPNLSPGDVLSIRAELPPGESVRYLLVAAFLRGATNPPPSAWFHKDETWTAKGAQGLRITVPDGAQQVLLFLAPRTGGDFKTLVDAVRGRPGAFVRASQDLNQAALDRTRLDAFLAALGKRDPGDPDRLKTVSPLLARSLTIKLNTDCFQRMPELQAACLSQGQDTLVLSDGHSASIVDALTSGPTSDLAFQLSATPQAGFSYASPYIAAVMDIARILNTFGTAQYQYIPALPTALDDRLALLLNAPPSFHNPLSVLVTALPAVEPPQPPPLQPVDPKGVYCVERTDLVLPVEGAPLAYSTHYAHDMVLTVKTTDGGQVNLPVRADAERGGFIANTAGVDAARFGAAIDGELHGEWGFQPFTGPAFHLQNVRATPWRLADDDAGSLIVGRDDTVRLKGPDAACVAGVSLAGAAGADKPVVWKVAGPDEISVTLPLTDAEPGALTLLVKQYGMKTPDAAPLHAFAQAGKLQSFTLHAGDSTGVLKGSRLDEVAGLTLAGVAFQVGDLTTHGGDDELTLTAADPAAAAALRPGQTATAKIALKDGRIAKLKVAVAAVRPQVTLIGKTVDGGPSPGAVTVELGDPNEMPQSAHLTFAVRADGAQTLSHHAAIEVATQDGSSSITLTPTSGLTLEDAHVALATLDPAKALGASAFGALKFRLVDGGTESAWQPLVTLVRLPVLRELRCRDGAKAPCELTGSSLFLIDSVSGDPSFDHAVTAPEGFTGDTLPTPHPTAGRLYLKLRDDPGVVGRLVLTPGAHTSALAVETPAS